VPTFPSWRPDRAIDHILVSEGMDYRNVRPCVPRARTIWRWRWTRCRRKRCAERGRDLVESMFACRAQI
jgi:hypothetical protein